MFDWARYLSLANELAARRHDEAALRSAVSRAYYAAFGKARNCLRAKGWTRPSTGNAHKVIWDQFRHADDAQRRSVGIAGDRLRRSRNKADYEDVFPGLHGAVRKAVRSARWLLQSLQNL